MKLLSKYVVIPLLALCTPLIVQADCTPTANPDLNHDGTVGLHDQTIVALSFGLPVDHPRFNSVADTNCDGSVDVSDILFVRNAFGQTFPLPPEVQINLLDLSEGTQFTADVAKSHTVSIDFMSSTNDVPFTINTAQTISPSTGLTVQPVLDGTTQRFSKSIINKRTQTVCATEPGDYTITATATATIIETGDTMTREVHYKVLPIGAPDLSAAAPTLKKELNQFFNYRLKPNTVTPLYFKMTAPSGRDYLNITGMTIVEPERGISIVLNDEGIGSDSEAGDRHYGSDPVDIDTTGMSSGECMAFHAIVSTTKGNVLSRSAEVCISALSFPKGYIIPKDDWIKDGHFIYAKNLVSVSFKKGTSDARILEILANVNGQAVPSSAFFMSFTIKLNVTPTAETALTIIHQIAEQLRDFPEVKGAGLVISASLFSSYTNDPLYNPASVPLIADDTPAVSQVRADEAWNYGDSLLN